ncbi:MAG: hypothetical protein ACE5EY_07395, partial [Anaerolineae bacterium]
LQQDQFAFDEYMSQMKPERRVKRGTAERRFSLTETFLVLQVGLVIVICWMYYITRYNLNSLDLITWITRFRTWRITKKSSRPTQRISS